MNRSIRRAPDPAARTLAHLIVGGATVVLLGKQVGWPGSLLSALATVALHQACDAPLAGVLAEAGI